MKLLLAGMMVGLVSLAQADEGDFAKFKAERLSHIDERIQKMQEHRNCVNAAQDKEAFKACRGHMKEWRMDEKEERMAKRKERREKRKEEKKDN